MTPEIERLAKEAELADEFGRPLPAYPRRLAKFAALLAEECAKECDEAGAQVWDEWPNPEYIADAIRAKFALSGLEDAAK